MPGTRLTIAIPTFNRADLLDEQLAWVARALKGYESRCELLISDNASTDATNEVVREHLTTLSSTDLLVRHVVQPSNLGAIRNIAFCIENATGQYVWTVSDDDEIAPDAVAKVLTILDSNEGVALLVLNFSNRHHRTGKRKFERCFENYSDEIAENGYGLFQSYLANPQPSRWGGLALTTALVYRSCDARAALAQWPGALENLTMQLFVSGFCARAGGMVVTQKTFLEMIGGRHFFESDFDLYTRFRFAQVPEAFVKLIEIGYSAKLLRRKILAVRKELKYRYLLRLLLRKPLLAIAIAARYGKCLATAQRLTQRDQPDFVPRKLVRRHVD